MADAAGEAANVAAMPQHKTEAYEDRRRKKELAEARQSGKAAPEIDVESGKMINPHNPEYITKRPWYLGESGPSLNHHAVQKKNHFITLHEADAVVRERKKTARKDARLHVGMWVEALYRGKNPFLPAKITKINLDGSAEVEFENGKVQKKVLRHHINTSMAFGSMVGIEEEGKLAYDAKRDRWNGYDPTAHKLTIDMYNRMDDERRKRRQAKKDEKFRRKQEAKKKEEEEKKARKLASSQKVKKVGGGSSCVTGKPSGDGSESPHTSDSGTDSDDTKAKNKSQARHSDSDDSDSDSDSDYDSDSDSDADGSDEEEDDTREFLQKDRDARDFQKRIARQGGLGGAQMKTTVRNLRIREDTAKYLRNLDPNSAYYDPKTRSMRDNPLPNENPEEVQYAGDNFNRYSGDCVELARTTLFAWEAHEKNQDVEGADLNLVANPSQIEFMRRQFQLNKSKLEKAKARGVLTKYGSGGAEKLDEDEKRRLALGASEDYVEYARDGRLIRGAQKAIAQSKYPEDIFVNNHNCVWGSYFNLKTFQWGYQDDHSTVRNSYSTGEAGRKANDAAAEAQGSVARPMLTAIPMRDRDKVPKIEARSKVYGENLKPELDEDKLKAALEKEEQFQRDSARHAEEADDKKRKYNSMNSTEVTQEEMEAWRMKRTHHDDPMANISSDTILDYKK